MLPKIITMHRLSIIYTLFLLISGCFSLLAQQNATSDKIVIDGKKYILYTAVSGDSPYSIARKFGISPEELKKANPDILEKLNSGQKVRIPTAANGNAPSAVNGLQNDDDRFFIFYSVRKKETVFSIAKKNNVTPEDIYRNNSRAKEGIKEGDVLKIPKPQALSVESKNSTNKFQEPIKHVVKRKESLFSIAREYNTTQEEILKMNPTISGNISKGTILTIPAASAPQSFTPNKPDRSEKFKEYRIVNGDNFFQLEKRFGISQSELMKLNPALSNGFNVGMLIKIPTRESVETKTPQTTDIKPNTDQKTDYNSVSSTPFTYKNQNKTFQIGLFLPFCQNLSDSTGISQRTVSFLEFYSGVLLATEKLTEAGMKLKLFVYDTFQDTKVVERLVKNPEFLSFDLIIGPVYPANQKTVAELSAKNRIPMVSPLSSDSRFVSATPGYFQINPGKKLRLASTADYIVSRFKGQNIIVLNQGGISGDVKLIFDRLNQKPGIGNVRQYNILAEGTSGLEGMLSADKENIIVLANENEADVSVAITRLNTISKSNKITVIGLQEYTKMQSIDIEYLHNIRLHYLSPYFIDYSNPKVITFIEKYRSSYNSEPTQYSFQGYDIALNFIGALGKSGKNFPETNPTAGVDLLQADYHFQKASDFGGYMNKTFYVIEYTDSYEVRSAAKIDGPNLTSSGNGSN